MKIHLPLRIQYVLLNKLRDAGKQEIGGILMGEHIGEEEFRVFDLTIQKHSGSLSSFLRTPTDAIISLRKFFKRTGNNYKRFNYLGEWHSHPSFLAQPSDKDIHSMVEIATDRKIGVNFVILLIVRLKSACELEANAEVFLSNGCFFSCEVIKEVSLE